MPNVNINTLKHLYSILMYCFLMKEKLKRFYNLLKIEIRIKYLYNLIVNFYKNKHFIKVYKN